MQVPIEREEEREEGMTMVRERRQQQALRLSIPLPPPPPPSMVSPCHELSLASPPLAIGSDSPIAIDSLADIERLSVIGDGVNGTVYKSRHRPTSALLALKILRLTSMDASHRIAREAEILMRLHSAYIVPCHAVLSDGADQLCLVMEYMDSGSLRDVLLARPCLPEPLIAAVVQQVLRGLKYLHAMGVMHRDIKPSNILINGHGEIKIADFGASRKATDGVRQPCAGTCAYMSPERIDGEQYGGEGGDAGFAGDVWALGVVALECSAGRFPMVGPGERPDWPTLACAACFGEPTPEVPKGASPEFRGFVGRCLERDWRRRATADELLHHPFLANCGSCPEGLVSDSLSNKGKFATSESNF